MEKEKERKKLKHFCFSMYKKRKCKLLNKYNAGKIFTRKEFNKFEQVKNCLVKGDPKLKPRIIYVSTTKISKGITNIYNCYYSK